ncbi:MAG: GIY-YIG nuclease family protein [Eubacterium sp.]|nr:GIY-YIG nuclease family protein [Candidatus Colimonas fimequi]
MLWNRHWLTKQHCKLNTKHVYDSTKDYPLGDCVYIMKCSDGTLYTGWTTDFKARVATHNSGRGAKYTRARLPVTPVYVEFVEDRSTGLKREHAIKKLTRKAKCQLIESDKNEL